MAKKKLPEVGAEIEALCSKCKVATVHVVSVIKNDKITKVMCKSCLSTHRFKSPDEITDEAPASKKKTAKKTVKKAKVPAIPKTREERKWNRLLAQVDAGHPIEYTMAGEYTEHDVISHSTFGLGVVHKVLDTNKMSVVFQIGVKTLVQKY